MEKCAFKANRECAVYVAKNMIHNMKKKMCLEKSVEKIFECYKSKVKQCKAKLLLDFLKTVERFGKIVKYFDGLKGLYAYCDVANKQQ